MMKKCIAILLPFLWCFLPLPGAIAQISGEIDSTFKTRIGFGPDIRNEFNLIIKRMPNGHILVGGKFQHFSGFRSSGLVQLLPDGQINPSFQVLLHSAQVEGFQILPDQKILAWGLFSIQEGGPSTGILRFLANGQLDPSFAMNSQILFCKDAASLSNGTIVARFFSAGPPQTIGMTANGSPDPNFQFQGQLDKIIPLPDEGFLILNSNTLQRFTNNGALNTNFLCVESFGGSAQILPESDGKLVCLVGQYYLFRLQPDGNLDSTFVPVELESSSNQIVKVDSNGDVYVRAIRDFAKNQILKFNTVGTRDNSYNNKFPAGLAYEVIPENNGAWFALGQFQLAHFDYEGYEVKRFNPSGEELGQRKTQGFNGLIEKMLVQPDKKILVSGTFTKFDSVSCVFLARLHPNGDLDTSFHSPFLEKNLKFFEIYQGWIRNLSCGADGKILVTGMFDSVGTTPKAQIALLLPSGAVDPNFTLDLSYLNEPNVTILVNEAFIMGNQKVYASIEKRNGSGEISRIIQANMDGSPNLDFQSQLPLTPGFRFRSLQKASEQTLFVESSTEGFTDGGIPDPTIINPQIYFMTKLNLDGSVDSTFQFQPNGSLAGAIHQIKMDSTGNVFVSYFSTFPWFNYAVGYLKCNPAGEMLHSYARPVEQFDPSGENYGIPAPMLVTPKNDLIIHKSDSELQKFCADGWSDAAFSANNFGGGFINDIAQADTQSVYVAGSFHYYNGNCINRIVRLKNYNCVTTSALANIKQDELLVFPNPGKNHFTIRKGAGLGDCFQVKVVDMQGREVIRFSGFLNEGENEKTFSAESLPTGLYHIQVLGGSKNLSTRWLKN